MEETTTTTPETNTASQETTPQETEPAKSAESTPAEKTFTQKELDDIVKQRLDRAKKDMPSKEELKAFREWKDSQKTAEQKAADDIAAANLAKEAAEHEKQALEIKVACLSTVTATAKDEDATVSIKVNDTVITSGSAATWITGANTVEVKVTNGDYSKTYTVTVTKE